MHRGRTAKVDEGIAPLSIALWRVTLAAPYTQSRLGACVSGQVPALHVSWRADIRWVQRQLGHASIGQTADTYGHVQPERHEAAVEGLDRYVGR